MKNKEIVDFYDEYSDEQINTGVNIRHYQIINKIIKAGLKKNAKVLEIGCGIGTLTGLVLSYIKTGSLTATDISGKSIEIARKRFGKYKNAEFVVSDMMDFTSPEKFDIIILPDVMEHIPLANHRKLFEIISKHIHDHSKIVINVPHPKIIEYYHQHSPEVLQIIDQSVWADQLITNAAASGLILKNYQSYSIHHKETDYAFIVFEKKTKFAQINDLTTLNIIRHKFIYRLFYLWKKI